MSAQLQVRRDGVVCAICKNFYATEELAHLHVELQHGETKRTARYVTRRKTA